MMKNLSFKKLFLIDSAGAIITALILSLVLANFQDFFGVPKKILYMLAGVALIYSIYSISCYLFVKKEWQTCLRIIAILNIIYCLSTFTILFFNRATITGFGVAYFIGELMIIMTLAQTELSFAKSNNPTSVDH